jgi:hypothetical protein
MALKHGVHGREAIHPLRDFHRHSTRVLSPLAGQRQGRQEVTGSFDDARTMGFASRRLLNRYRFAWKST